MKKKCKYLKWYHKLFIQWMPNFWENMPEDKHGYNWQVSVIRVRPFMSHEMKKGNYNSLQHAYVKARWLAYWYDRWSRGSSFGVEWGIKKIKEDEEVL